MGWFNRREREMTLMDLVEFLEEHPGMMYVLPSRRAAMVYYAPNEAVLVIEGDFSGGAEECNRELQRNLKRIIASETAWMN